MRGRLSFVVALVTVLAGWPPARAALPPVPIPHEPAQGSASFLGAAATPNPIMGVPPVPQHPFMASNGNSNIHVDAYMTDANTGPGPLGRAMEVRSTLHVGECATVTFDSHGRIVTVCVGPEGPRLTMINAQTLETLAIMPLPARNPAGAATFLSDISGGGYFYLDNWDRAVVPTTDRRIFVVAETDSDLTPSFTTVATYDLSGVMADGDKILSVLPDWSGRLWFATAKAVVGTVDPLSGVARALSFPGEAMGNSFAVDDTGGVFIVTDHAMYRFDADVQGAPVMTWREEYDRGTRFKPGQLNFGSGTTPTLMGEDLVAITDNADPHMNVLVYRRAAQVDGARLLCAEPVFPANQGATDQSLIAAGDAIIVANNYGYSGVASTTQGGTSTPGLTRVDVDRATSTCETIWENTTESAPSVVPKVSLANGLVYTYTKPAGDSNDPWYFTALDFRTGQMVYKQFAGSGFGFNNNWAPVTLGPDATAYVGVLGGLVSLRDTP